MAFLAAPAAAGIMSGLGTVASVAGTANALANAGDTPQQPSAPILGPNSQSYALQAPPGIQSAPLGTNILGTLNQMQNQYRV